MRSPQNVDRRVVILKLAVGGNLSKPITEMTIAELKSYLVTTRNDDEKFSQAMGELLKKLPDREKWHQPFADFDDAEKFFKQNPLQ